MNMKYETAEYNEGWNAAENGESFNDCPYPEFSKEYNEWARGYDDYNGDCTE